MSIYITGDVHCGESIDKFWEFLYVKILRNEQFTKDDYIIVCGDFGLLWEDEPGKLEKLLAELYEIHFPWTTLFIDGNHENFNRLEKLPEVEMFGGLVDKYSDSIYHLKRGEVYTIEGKKFLTIGGALSIDIEPIPDEWPGRILNKSYWKQELLSDSDKTKITKALIDNNFEFDYIITHTAPSNYIYDLIKVYEPNYVYNNKKKDWNEQKIDDPVAKFLEYEVLRRGVKFKRWFCGHLHDDIPINDKFMFTYDTFTKIV